MAVNSGAAQMAKQLGDDAKGLIFTQIVPFRGRSRSPSSRSTSRHWRDTRRLARSRQFSGPEGYASARVLVAGLRSAGAKNLSRDSLQRAMETLGSVDLGGMTVQYAAGAHPGSSFVDTVIVATDGRFAR